MRHNIDEKTAAGFGDEWTRFDQSRLSAEQRKLVFDEYFSLLDLDNLPVSATVVDVGCGSGRWAAELAARRHDLRLRLVDASDAALSVARGALSHVANAQYFHCSVGALPFENEALDGAISLGVLHHVPDTASAITEVARVLKPGAPFLMYLYYAFDNRPWWFRALWRLSEVARFVISRMPHAMRYWSSQIIAVLVYWPLGRTATILARLGALPDAWPLRYYHDKSFYVMRTDALDRFGTRLEQRFSRAQITLMLTDAGLGRVEFSKRMPGWISLAYKL